MKTLVFDIETIPDLETARKLYHLDALSDEETFSAVTMMRRIKNGHDFLPLHLQKIIAISLVLQDNSNVRVWSLGSMESDEKDLIKRFITGLEKYTPILVSWNGCGFDLPVLHYRMLLHGISAPTYWENGENHSHFRWNNYLNRFHYRHLDLMDVLAAYQGRANAPLDEIATMLGFPGKMGMNGAKVWDAYQKQQLMDIRNYCETDVLNTYCVYLRFELMRGVLSPESYTQQMQILRDYLAGQTERSHLQAFNELIRGADCAF